MAIYAEALELGSTETKGTVLLESAEQLMNFSKGEELSIRGLYTIYIYRNYI